MTSKEKALLENSRPSSTGSWQCASCKVRNGAGSITCTECKTSKSIAKESSTHLQSSTGFSLAEKFKPPEGTWECGTCLIRNKASDTACVACETPKPCAAGGSITKKGGAVQVNDSSVISLSDKFKPPPGSWTCDLCWIQNKSDATMCVACESPKPGLSDPSASSSIVPLSALLKTPNRSWKCDTCLVSNKATDVKCAACQSLKPGASNTNSQSESLEHRTASNSNSATLSLVSKIPNSQSTVSEKPSLADMFKPAAGSWECDQCMVRNNGSQSRCVSCEAPKPGSETPLKAPPASASQTSGFQFGAVLSSSQNSQQANKPFTFGAAATSMQPTAGSFTASNSFSGTDSAKAGSTTSAVPSFGGTSSGIGTAPTNASATGLFGAHNSTPVFGQGAPQHNSFGAPANSVPAFGSGSSVPAFGASAPAFGGTNQPNTNNSGFQEAKVPTFQFGQNNNNNPSSGNFTFAAATPQSTNQAGYNSNQQPTTFNFGAAPATNQPAFHFSAATSTEVNPLNVTAPTSGRKFKKAVGRTGRKT